MTQTRVAAVLAAGALVLAACGGGDDSTDTTTGSPRAVEAAVARTIDQQLSTRTIEVTGVKCPDDVKPGAGATFTCSVRWNNGAAGEAKVTPKSLTKVAYEVVDGSVKVPGSTVTLAIDQDLATQAAPDAQANCPRNITVRLGRTFKCRLAHARGRVSYAFSDETGTVDPTSVTTG
jgi:hypothetical protein